MPSPPARTFMLYVLPVTQAVCTYVATCPKPPAPLSWRSSIVMCRICRLPQLLNTYHYHCLQPGRLQKQQLLHQRHTSSTPLRTCKLMAAGRATFAPFCTRRSSLSIWPVLAAVSPATDMQTCGLWKLLSFLIARRHGMYLQPHISTGL